LQPKLDSSSSFSQQQPNSQNITKNLSLNKTFALNGSATNNSSQNKQQLLPTTTNLNSSSSSSPPSTTLFNNNLNKKPNETGLNNEQNKSLSFSSTAPPSTPLSAPTPTSKEAMATIISLNDSDYNLNGSNIGGGIYFLMQTSSDLVSQQIKSHQTLNYPILTLNKTLDINELTTNPANNTTFINNSPDSSSSSTCSTNSSPNGSTKVVRDERRRANHNEGNLLFIN